MRELASITVRLRLAFKDFSFEELEANSTSTTAVYKIESIWKLLSIKVLLKLIELNLSSLGFILGRLSWQFDGFCSINPDIFLLAIFIFELIFVTNESFYLKVNQIIELFPPHPICQYNHH